MGSTYSALDRSTKRLIELNFRVANVNGHDGYRSDDQKSNCALWGELYVGTRGHLWVNGFWVHDSVAGDEPESGFWSADDVRSGPVSDYDYLADYGDGDHDDDGDFYAHSLLSGLWIYGDDDEYGGGDRDGGYESVHDDDGPLYVCEIFSISLPC
jgi:hypothetical protein